MLLVEDEVSTLRLLAAILAKKYPQTTLYTAINGRIGMEVYNSHTPDIIVTDLNMPEMDGVQMTSKIRALNSDTKFVVLTGNTGKPDLRDSEGKEFKFDHLIVKPVDFRELFAAIDQCLGEITCVTPCRSYPETS
jgi:YesN/AraC family two-component response regulator